MNVQGQVATLTTLVAECYGLSDVTLKSISPYHFEDRGIYQVAGRDGSAFVLRAFRDDVSESLNQQITVLEYLRKQRFTAPTVRLTSSGAAVARFQGWSALLVSYVDGAVAGFSPEDVERLAEKLARLHNVSGADTSGYAGIGRASRHPERVVERALTNLARALPHIPAGLHSFLEDSVVAIQDIRETQRSGQFPETIVHGDCWPANAVKTSDGDTVLIDWDRAGIGPAFLDLCYLLLMCHLGKPQLPAMEPDVTLISAVVHGYCRRRYLSAAELNVLDQGLLYDVALRAGLEIDLERPPDQLVEDIWLQKQFARYRVCPRIAEIARVCFEHCE